MAATTWADIEALLGDQDATEVVQMAERQSVALSTFTIDPMTKGRKRTPLVSVLPTAAFETGELGSDARRKNISPFAVEPKYLVAANIATIIPFPEEAIMDADYDIWAAIRPGIATAFAKTLDAAVLFGTGKPAAWTDAAIVPGATAAGNVYAAGTGIDLGEDLNQTMALVEADGYDVSDFYARRTIRAALRGLRDDSGTPIYQNLREGDAVVPTVYGLPINLVQNGAWDSTAALAIAGDAKMAHIGVRQDMSFKILDQATLQTGTNTFIHLGQEDALALRVVFRVGYCVFDPVNPETADGYPFAVLTPAP